MYPYICDTAHMDTLVEAGGVIASTDKVAAVEWATNSDVNGEGQDLYKAHAVEGCNRGSSLCHKESAIRPCSTTSHPLVRTF